MSGLDIGSVRDALLALVLALPRMLVCMLLIPVFGATVLSKTIRTAMAIGFTLPIAVGIALSPAPIGGPLTIVALILKEGFLGVALGFALATPFWAMDSIGSLLDIQRGANTGQQLTPFAQQDASLIGMALQLALIALLAASGGLTALYRVLLTSYEAWPVLSLIPAVGAITAASFIAGFAELCELTLLYALPLLAILMLVDFCFALVGLFATQLQVYFAAMPVKSIVGMFVLLLYLGTLFDHGSGYFERVIERQMTLFHTVSRP